MSVITNRSSYCAFKQTKKFVGNNDNISICSSWWAQLKVSGFDTSGFERERDLFPRVQTITTATKLQAQKHYVNYMRSSRIRAVPSISMRLFPKHTQLRHSKNQGEVLEDLLRRIRVPPVLSTITQRGETEETITGNGTYY